MPFMPRSKHRRLALCVVLALVLFAPCETRPGEEVSTVQPTGATRLEVYETTVTVRSNVRCRKYEGRVLFCTLNPLSAVREVLDARLVLGYASVSIGEESYRVEPHAEGEVKLYPTGERYRKDYSGEQELKIAVVYVN